MVSPDGDNRRTNEYASLKKKEVAKVKVLSRHSSADYPTTKRTSSKTQISKRSSLSSSSSSNARYTQASRRANSHQTHALRGVGSQFRHAARVETIRKEIEFDASINTNSMHHHDAPREPAKRRIRGPGESRPEHLRTFNDTLEKYLQSQEDPSQQYALFCRSDTGHLSTQRQR